MFSTQDIIEKLWNAQGYGNLAVWEDGSTQVIEPGVIPTREGKNPLVVFKPIVLVARFPMLDHAISDKELQETIVKTIRDAGGEVS
jgi:hypothetical protein